MVAVFMVDTSQGKDDIMFLRLLVLVLACLRFVMMLDL